ncbi:leucine-rich repeat-containing protein 40-like [Armigeres subalbatus]|uniref:leucine-rich repeat-containing protein 40-like n=1 Tax=Armigeres subalbatus TaxID=124917 RepID=UPI002ED1643F
MDLHLINVTIENSTADTFGLLGPSVAELHLIKCTASEVFLNPFVIALVIEDSNVSEVIPHCVGQNETFNVEEIHFRNTQIASFPRNISRLTKLKKIMCIESKLRMLDFDSLSNLKELEIITFCDSFISEVVNNKLMELPKLTLVNLSRNQISHIPTTKWNTPLLLYLLLDNNNLRQFPQIKHFPRIELISLNYNTITNIDMEDVSGMEHLHTICLRGNQLLHLEASAKIHLPSLGYLNVDHNRLRVLDISKWNVPALNVLNVSNNQLRMIVDFESLADTLTLFNATDNPWDCEWALFTMVDFKMSIQSEWAKACLV